MAAAKSATSRTLGVKRAVEILQQSKLVDLNQTVGSVVGLASRLEDIDGYAICWLHYVLIGPGPRFEDVVQPQVRG